MPTSYGIENINLLFPGDDVAEEPPPEPEPPPPPALETFEQTIIGSAGSTIVTINAPVSAVPGDRLLASISFRTQGTVAPSELGWTELSDTTQTNGPTQAVYERIVQIGDPSSYTFTLTGATGRVVGTIARISNSVGVEAFLGQTGLSATPTAPAITALGDGRLLVSIWTKANLETFTGYPPTDMTAAWDLASLGTAGGYVEQAAASQLVNAGSTGARALGITGGISRGWSAFNILFLPAGA